MSQTRLANDIRNCQDRIQPDYGLKKHVEDLIKKYTNAKHRPVGPCATYNCHGLTFASRRTQITDSQEVAYILADDDYVKVDLKAVMAGDIAIYKKSGDIEHSGMVVHKDEFGPWILSKWGSAHEAIHRPADCEYDATGVEYYRISE